MKPLIFLTVRTFINGIKRALTSAKRLISLIFFLSYYVLVIMRPFERTPRKLQGVPSTPINMPEAGIVDAVVFGGFALLSLFLMLGVFGKRATFRPADVDVLFPTPVNPRLVLVFRIVRDYLVTLLLPLIFVIFAYRPTAMGMRNVLDNLNDPSALTTILRTATAGWLLIAMCWVCIGYAAGMFVDRSDLGSTRNRKVMTWSGVALLAVLSLYIFLNVRQMSEAAQAVEFAHSPVLRTFFFTATAATTMVMGAYQGLPVYTLIGAGAMVTVIIVSLLVALSQVGWMYDQAAARGFEGITTRELQQKGDVVGLLAEQARRGKIKAGKIRWYHRIRAPGPWALLWKDVVIQMRSSLATLLVFTPLVLFMALVPVFGIDQDLGASGGAFLFMLSFGVFLMCMGLAQTGYIEVLRRVDVQKPLPFTSSTIVFMETASKAIPAVFVGWFASVVALILKPAIWQECLAAILAVPFSALLICATVFLVTILFPDIDDPTQRGFRGMMVLLGLMFAAVPGVLAFTGVYLFSGLALMAAVVNSALNLGITAGIATVAGSQYATYNPSD